MNLDELNTIEVLKLINDGDKQIACAVEKQLDNISKAVDLIVESIENEGRLIYIGSGTSGKLGVIDASECPPTFGTDDSLVVGIVSGGTDALSGWLEHTEDDTELGIIDLKEIDLRKNDILVGITASGNTPYAISALKYGKSLGCKAIGISCSDSGLINEICDVSIQVIVGPEILLGSTRMKAGTAQKMVLNMISTTVMIKLGKTYSNLMVNVKPINIKLQNRVVDIVKEATKADVIKVRTVVQECNYDAKTAIIVIETGSSILDAVKLLEKSNGNVWKTLQLWRCDKIENNN
ncbi:N-acetylmuramic acid 6-phosphate etherase [Clostridium sp.]|jgi:N-acetylmuramic acid 6-phosphate etherase|uniref:N-acetylmuramic acid 6-phosphate etherase n=1 Tax=Clostridium sp. TaxID=1506 RepID=UPI003EED7F25